MKTVSVTLFLLLAVAMLGCNSSDEAPEVSTTPDTTSVSEHDHGDHAHGDHGDMTDMEMMKENLAKLSPEDAASAEKQHVCPVTGEMLATMGLPIKVTVKDQDVWVCCDDCIDKLKTNPDKYLAKLKK